MVASLERLMKLQTPPSDLSRKREKDEEREYKLTISRFNMY